MEVLINVLKVKERMLGETARKLMVVEIDKTDVVQLHMVEVVVYEMFVAHDLVSNAVWTPPRAPEGWCL